MRAKTHKVTRILAPAYQIVLMRESGPEFVLLLWGRMAEACMNGTVDQYTGGFRA